VTADTLATTYHVISVVWGREYLDLFLNTCLPTQLGEGNVSALPPGSRYRIMTRAADVDEIQHHGMIQALARVIPVDVVPVTAFEEAERGNSSYRGDRRFDLVTECNRIGIRDAISAGAALLLPSPDYVMSANTFEAIVRRHRQGYRAVGCIGLRLEKEGFLRSIDASGRPLAAPSSRELVRMAMPHLHAHTRSMFADARTFDTYPLGVYWRVGSDGLLGRSFHVHPIMVDPMRPSAMPKLTIDSGYLVHACPDFTRVHVVTDSDEFIVFELTEANRSFRCTTGAEVALWRAAAMAARCDQFGIQYWQRYPIFIHGRDVDERWSDAEASAARFVRAVMRRTAPFGTPWPRWYRWIERAHHLDGQARRAWRRNVPHVRTKQIARAVRVAKSRANRMLKRITRQLFGHTGVFSR
jgi:hypothetical protein